METKMAYLGDSSLCKDGISPWAGNFPYKNKNPSALLPFPPPPPQRAQCYCYWNTGYVIAGSTQTNLRL